LRQFEAFHLFLRPFVIFSRTDDELHLVAPSEVLDVREKIASALAAAWRFQIHDPINPRVDPRDIVRAARLEQYRLSRIGQHRHEP
jgi:hypothetical protein